RAGAGKGPGRPRRIAPPVLGTIALALILCYVVVITLAASSRAADPLVRRSVRYGAFVPVGMIVLVRLAGLAATLVIVLAFAGCSLLAVPAGRRERAEGGSAPPRRRPA